MIKNININPQEVLSASKELFPESCHIVYAIDYTDTQEFHQLTMHYEDKLNQDEDFSYTDMSVSIEDDVMKITCIGVTTPTFYMLLHDFCEHRERDKLEKAA